jgi:hypothetical protein
MDFAADVDRLSRTWPKEEVYGLTSQARRAAAAIPANIAEGYGRQSTASFAQEGACADALQQADELGRMLGSLIISLSKISAGQ